jgi:hypothetical protein
MGAFSETWLSAPDDWICPGCGRSKFDIVRVTKKGERGFLVRHHCHSNEKWGYSSNVNNDRHYRRFDTILVCEDCNFVDSRVKNKFNTFWTEKGRNENEGSFGINLEIIPSRFSFSPSEISKMIVSRPRERHLLSYEIAWSIFIDLLPQVPYDVCLAGIAFKDGAYFIDPEELQKRPENINRRFAHIKMTWKIIDRVIVTGKTPPIRLTEEDVKEWDQC